MVGRTTAVLAILVCAGCAAGDERASDTTLLGALNSGDAGAPSAPPMASPPVSSTPATMLLPPQDMTSGPATAGMPIVGDASTDVDDAAAGPDTSTTGDGGDGTDGPSVSSNADAGMCAKLGCYTVLDCSVYNTVYPTCKFTMCDAYVCK